MFYIENEQLKIAVETKGAELQNIYSKETNLEYLWNGDPASWAKRSPILFPIVGTLKNDRYTFNDKTYHLTRHGFARDLNFNLVSQKGDSLTLMLRSDVETLMKYPFHFELYVTYTLDKNKLKVNYRVVNTGSNEMYFSIGGHPAFRLPLEEELLYEDYFIKFAERESLGRWPISREGLIEALPIALIEDTDILPLNHELFQKDAIVFKYPESKSLQVITDKSTHGFTFDFTGFPFLGIWSYKNANFICIEPWCGIADSVASDHQLLHKEGMNILTPEQEFQRVWNVTFF